MTFKDIKELEAEIQDDGFSHNDVEEGKIQVLKDVVKLIDELGKPLDAVDIEELKARIEG